MRILAVSDEESLYIWDHFNPEVFSGVEMIFSCGDLDPDYLEFLATLIPAPLFYVPGNHDKRFITDPPGGCILADGRVETYKGIRIAGLGGCKSGNPTAAYEYSEPVMARRVAKLSKQIQKKGGLDILLTHAPAKGLGDGNDRFHEGFECFLQLLDRHRPAYYFYGHQHKRYGLVKSPGTYNNSKLINACGYTIMDIIL